MRSTSAPRLTIPLWPDPLLDGQAFPPVATNWGYFSTPETEAGRRRQARLYPAEMNKAAGELHAALVDQVPFLFVAHDVGPRAIPCGDRGGATAELVYRPQPGEQKSNRERATDDQYAAIPHSAGYPHHAGGGGDLFHAGADRPGDPLVSVMPPDASGGAASDINAGLRL